MIFLKMNFSKEGLQTFISIYGLKLAVAFLQFYVSVQFFRLMGLDNYGQIVLIYTQ